MAGAAKILSGFILLIVCFYLVLSIYLNQYRLPVLKLENLLGKKKKYKILAVDPHPDDETMISGGFISRFGKHENVELKHICVTKGEKGDELLKVSEYELAKVREVEYQNAMEKLGLDNYEMWDFNDGQLENQINEVKKKLRAEINKFNPDLILVYEKAGLYGHPDHVALSAAVYELASNRQQKSSQVSANSDKRYSQISGDNKETKVLYKTLPKSVLKHIKLPLHMANGKKIVQAEALYRLPVWQSIFRKYKAAKQHKSQNLGQGKPLWLLMLLFNNEYFTDKY